MSRFIYKEREPRNADSNGKNVKIVMLFEHNDIIGEERLTHYIQVQTIERFKRN